MPPRNVNKASVHHRQAEGSQVANRMDLLTAGLSRRVSPGPLPTRAVLTRSDLLACLVLGEAVAWMLQPLGRVWQLPAFLFSGIHMAPVAAPLGAIMVVYGGSLLARRWPNASAVSKFVLVGALNTLIDFCVFNLLLYFLGTPRGGLFAAAKAAGFAVAVTNSYFWNKHWCFAPGGHRSQSYASKEIGQFVAVTLIGLALNVAVATTLFRLLASLPALSLVQWGNVAAALALAVSAVWDFCAYRFIVFAPKVAPDPRR